MSAGYSATVSDFLNADLIVVKQALGFQAMSSYRVNEAQQIRAWEISLAILREALRQFNDAKDWRLLLEFPIRRLGRRIDALLITERGILVLAFKVGAAQFAHADRRQTEDYALDLQDFHSGSGKHPIIPILVATEANPRQPEWPLFLAGTSPVLDTSGGGLRSLLEAVWARLPMPTKNLDVTAWESAPYRPVPGIIDAACTLYSHHGVADIAAASADAINLSKTTHAILTAIQHARSHHRHIALYVTGIPGAGKTLCGLNAVFGAGRDAHATFLTGNPTLVHVLREALARDAAFGDRQALRAARQRTKSSIQALPAFRDHYVNTAEIPPERITIIDEAQRAWSRDHAVRKSLDRPVRLTDSEPAHILEIMGRHADWVVVVCLIGNGQEIHDGEGGLAEWGAALATQKKWIPVASPAALTATDPRQRLPQLAGLVQNTALHLDVPMRSLRNNAAAAWVDAVLSDEADVARQIADTKGPIPFAITRDLLELRDHLRHVARGNRRCGLIASSGAKRLRAEGLGSELPHMDAGAVARWFLDHFPEDVRASDALEQVATEFSCQGLEIDHVGLCWGGDLIRADRWRVRDFVGTRWNLPRGTETIANRINTYRVLLTRARYETVIWVPRGDLADRTRPPREMDDVAAFLIACGAKPLATLQLRPTELPRQSLLL